MKFEDLLKLPDWALLSIAFFILASGLIFPLIVIALAWKAVTTPIVLPSENEGGGEREPARKRGRAKEEGLVLDEVEVTPGGTALVRGSVPREMADRVPVEGEMTLVSESVPVRLEMCSRHQGGWRSVFRDGTAHTMAQECSEDCWT